MASNYVSEDDLELLIHLLNTGISAVYHDVWLTRADACLSWKDDNRDI